MKDFPLHSSGQPVRTVILGCGAITEHFHAPALRALQQSKPVSVTHIFDPSKERVASIRKLFPESDVIASIEELAAIRPEIVIVASPVRFHAEQSIAALEAGAAVLCEKPMAANTEEARQMIRVSERAKRPLAIGLCRRFLAAAETIKQMLDNGMLGGIKSFIFQEGYDFKWPAQSPAFFQKKMGGGGVLLDLGVHVIDLLVWWFGSPSAFTYQDDAYGGVEANCQLHLEYPSGLHGTVRLSRDCSMRRYCRIEGQNGYVEWNDVQADCITLKLKEQGHHCRITMDESSNTSHALKVIGSLEMTFVAQISNLIDSIHKVDSVRIPGTEGIRSLEIIEQCYAMRKPWPMPWFSEQEKVAVLKGYH